MKLWIGPTSNIGKGEKETTGRKQDMKVIKFGKVLRNNALDYVKAFPKHICTINNFFI